MVVMENDRDGILPKPCLTLFINPTSSKAVMDLAMQCWDLIAVWTKAPVA